jgi:nucleoside-triphosphatase
MLSRRRAAGIVSRMKVLLEGRPGVGKTTVARRLADRVKAKGFVTGEIREGRTRVGFAVESLDGERAVVAHVDFPGPPRVGKYGVDVEAFERVALPALKGIRKGQLVVIDEIGKMELASEAFCEAVERLVERDVLLVATVHSFRHPFTDALKRRDDVEVVKVTAANRDELPERLAGRLSRGG